MLAGRRFLNAYKYLINRLLTVYRRYAHRMERL